MIIIQTLAFDEFRNNWRPINTSVHRDGFTTVERQKELGRVPHGPGGWIDAKPHFIGYDRELSRNIFVLQTVQFGN